MALVRISSFPKLPDVSSQFDGLQSQMSRLFDDFLGQPMVSRMMERLWVPAVDMYETKDEIVVSAELPGLNEKDIRVSVVGDVLTIHGERQVTDEAREAGHYRQERWFGKFERALSLPVPVEVGEVKATYRDGVLTVKLPKSEAVKPREIKIDTV